MSRKPRRLVAGLASSLVLAVSALGGLAFTASPAAAASPVAAVTPAVTCDGTLILNVCVPIGGGGAGGGGGTCALTGTPLAALCDLLPVPGGGTSLPSGASTADPDTYPNTATSQAVTITDPLTQIYSGVGGGATVQLVGPGTSTDEVVNGTVGTLTDTTIPVTFDLFDGPLGTPVDPGTYKLEISAAALGSSSLTTLLTAVGLTSLPLDTVNVTVTADDPTPQVAVGLAPGGLSNTTITTPATTGTPFTAGDTVSFTDSSATAVPGLTFTNPAVSAAAITGTVNATAAVAIGSYNLVVTDTAGQTGVCTGCVMVAAGPTAVTGLVAFPTSGSTLSVAWTAPTGDVTVTSYSIVVSKISSATQSDTGVSTTQATATSTSATVSGLTPGTKYYVTVTPKHDTVAGAAANTSALTPYQSTLTLSGSPANAVGGAKVTFTGQLRYTQSGTTHALAAKTIGLYVKLAGSTKTTKLTTFTTDSSGDYTYSFVPTKGGTYLTYFAGDAAVGSTPGHSPALSTVLTQTVTPTVSIEASAAAHGSHATIKVTGTVTPTETGKKVVVYRTIKGVAKKFGKAKIAANGKYKLVKKGLSAGKYKLQTKVKARTGLGAASSNKFKVTIN